eukprot:8056997-Alexandrium_andersonii.AAC.1
MRGTWRVTWRETGRSTRRRVASDSGSCSHVTCAPRFNAELATRNLARRAPRQGGVGGEGWAGTPAGVELSALQRDNRNARGWLCCAPRWQ